jgi:gamma-glutamyltranspeptidase/glutathione hydrolase
MTPRPAADGDTAYLCCTDSDGLSVSLIQSNFTAIGSGVHVPGWGINLHNRGSAFNLHMGHPNAIDGAKLPMHTLIPAMVERDGVLTHVFGTMGGHAQAQIHLQVLTRMLHDGDGPQPAIDAPRFHVDPATGDVQIEARVPDGVLDDLRSRGHRIVVVRDFDDAMGHAHAIQFLRGGGLSVGADPRAESAALGL